ncbi:hypothetical protein C8Q75DRAFT_400166 [Abortiporus biennis]|nr:hypothetical protein C8Q75DRAFT_400166 [Abortiporus biennis]
MKTTLEFYPWIFTSTQSPPTLNRPSNCLLALSFLETCFFYRSSPTQYNDLFFKHLEVMSALELFLASFKDATFHLGSSIPILFATDTTGEESAPQCCHCGWRGGHAPTCPFR